MTRQVVTTTPHNSGLGDPAFSAFEKLNANDAELYAAAGVTGASALSAATYAIARTLTGTTSGDRLQVLGRTTQSDGGQGLFTWVAGGTTTVDEGYALSATGGIWRRADLTNLYANWFGVTGDNATDNGLMINKWTAAATELIKTFNPTTVTNVKMVLSPTTAGGAFQTTLRHTFPGQADVFFEGGARLIATGTDETAPLMTHGNITTTTSGRLQGIAVDTTIVNNFYNPEFVGVRLLNKQGATHEILWGQGFYRWVQLQANTKFCAYNTIILGMGAACKEHVNFNVRDNVAGFVAQNTIISGDLETTSALNNYGSMYAWTFTEDYENNHSGMSGNFWYSASCQLANPANTWTGTTVYTAGQRIYTPKVGGEWLVKTGGTSGTVEPSILPAVVDKTNITITAGSAIITMASTTGIVAGQHLRGANPMYAFPVNTYVQSNDSGTQVTLTQAAAAGSSSTTYHGSFVATTTDNTQTLVYLGPYRRTPVWMRNCGATNGMINSRWESGSGEALIISGTHLYPEAITEQLGGFTGTFQAGPGVAIHNVCNQPVWVNAHAYVLGDMVRPAVLGAVYWECIVAGTSGGSEPVPANSTAGSTFTDNTVTWLTRPIRNTQSNGDWGEYVGGNPGGSFNTWNISIANTSDEQCSSAGIDNIHYRAVGSAAGWRVKGLIKSNANGDMTTDFAAADFALCRDGLSHLVTGTLVGFIFDTNYNKVFIIKRSFGAYNNSTGVLIPLDATAGHAYPPLLSPDAQAVYHRRIQSIKVLTGAHTYADTSGANGSVSQYLLVNDEVKYVFFGSNTGNLDVPTISGLSVTVAQHRARTNPSDSQVLISSFQGGDYGGRSSLGTPTIGFFLCKGEYITNASAVAGNTTPRGYVVTTAGVKAPNWVTSTAYLKGRLVTAGGNVYAANGKFTSGTTPSGTGNNFLDATATAINSGDVATWDWVSVAAVLAADSNIP